jgi:UDP:flavonoid glycosyltransferase YjiC (YdhE family)
MNNDKPYKKGIPARKKRILFANIPADGHFNPLTPIAIALKEAGHDVRWYSGNTYAERIRQLDIPHYPFQKAKEVTVHNIDEVFPERKQIRSQISKVVFDICAYFIARAEEFYQDICEINNEFDFDLLVADCTFTGISFTRRLLKKEVVAVGVLPFAMKSADLGPTLMGIAPPSNFAEKKFQQLLRRIEEQLLTKPTKLIRRIHAKYGIDTGKLTILDIQLNMCSLYLQNGTQGFEYFRSDLDRKIRFAGPLLPVQHRVVDISAIQEKMKRYSRTILLTQGTFEPDASKLIIPVLEGYKNTDRLVVVTTAGFNTEKLRKQFPFDNIIIKDYIPYDQLMPYIDVYVSNGGYGGVIYGIVHGVPMVVAGVHEGKNEVCKRVEYFGLGINLKSENPHQKKLLASIEKVLTDVSYRTKTLQLSREFQQHDARQLCLDYISKIRVAEKNRTFYSGVRADLLPA